MLLRGTQGMVTSGNDTGSFFCIIPMQGLVVRIGVSFGVLLLLRQVRTFMVLTE